MGDNPTAAQETIVNNLLKREDERVAVALQRRDEREKFSVAEETLVFFSKKFNNIAADIEAKLTNSAIVEKSLLYQHFDQIASDIVQLQSYISESSVFLAQYDIRSAQNAVVDLQRKARECKAQVIPKKKFAFKPKEKTQHKDKSDNLDISSSSKVIPVDEVGLNIDLADCKFVHKVNEKLYKNSDEINGKDIVLSDLTNCVITLYGSPSVVHINGLVNCQLRCGPVSGSMFITGCSNCSFSVACQQLRIHSTTRSRFYMHVTSRAIIEDCSDIHVAEYNWNYDNIDEHYALSKLDRTINNWKLVNDFNWLNSNIQSPNWSILEDGKGDLAMTNEAP